MFSLRVIQDDNLAALQRLPDASFDLIYIDPPFNTGTFQERGHGYGYEDAFSNFQDFIKPRLIEAYRLLSPNGSLFFHQDYREIHYSKITLDGIFGRASFINEIIWAYDYGARSKTRWPAKHDNILMYAKDPDNFIFNYSEMDRIPYMAPGLVGKEKAALGKTPTDVWWNTIVATNGKEKTGYPTQKPLAILKRIIKIHSHITSNLLDFFAGSGSFGEAAFLLGRDCTLIDKNPQAIEIMRKRLSPYGAIFS